MRSVIENVARLGIMGFAAVVVVGTVAGLAVFGVVHMPDHDITKQLVTVLVTGAGAALAASGKFFNRDG